MGSWIVGLVGTAALGLSGLVHLDSRAQMARVEERLAALSSAAQRPSEPAGAAQARRAPIFRPAAVQPGDARLAVPSSAAAREFVQRWHVNQEQWAQLVAANDRWLNVLRSSKAYPGVVPMAATLEGPHEELQQLVTAVLGAPEPVAAFAGLVRAAPRGRVEVSTREGRVFTGAALD